MTTETGEPTAWDIAFREGYARGLAKGSGAPYAIAWAAARNMRGEKLSVSTPAKVIVKGRLYWSGRRSVYRGLFVWLPRNRRSIRIVPLNRFREWTKV